MVMIQVRVVMILIFLINKVRLNNLENNDKEVITDVIEDNNHNEPVEEEVKTDELPPQGGKTILF